MNNNGASPYVSRPFAAIAPTQPASGTTAQRNEREEGELSDVDMIDGEQTTQGPNGDATSQAREDAERTKAKNFILHLWNNGYGFQDMCREDLDRDLLQALYEELRLPLGREIPSTPRSSGARVQPEPATGSVAGNTNRSEKKMKTRSSAPMPSKAGANSHLSPVKCYWKSINGPRRLHCPPQGCQVSTSGVATKPD